MGRITLLLGAIALTIGCATPAPKTPKAPLIGELAKASIPIELPSSTIAMMRVRLADALILWGRIAPSLRKANPQFDAQLAKVGLSDPAHMIAWGIVSGAAGARLKPPPAKVFEHLDRTGTIHIAVGLPGNDAFFEAVDLGVPLLGAESMPQGPLLRVYLPSLNPPALAAVLETQEARRALIQAASKTWRVQVLPRGVQLDLRPFDIQPLVDRLKLGVDRTRVEADTTFLGRDTPGLRAYLTNDSSFGAFLRSDRLHRLATHTGQVQVFEALEVATPENRGKLWLRGMWYVLQSTSLDDPSRHEVYDTTMLLKIAPEAGLAVEVAQSLTPLGQKLRAGKAQGLPVSAPYAMGEFLRVGLDPRPNKPDSMPTELEDKTPLELREVMRDAGPISSMLMAMNHPSAMLHVYKRMGQTRGSSDARIFEALSRLRGLRVAVGLERGSGRPKPQIAVSLAFDIGEPFEWAKKTLMPLLGRSPMKPQVVALATHGEIRLSQGQVNFKDNQASESPFSLSMTPSALVAGLGDVTPPVVIQLMTDLLGADAVIAGEMRNHKDHMIVRLATTSAKDTRFGYPKGANPKSATTTLPKTCLRETRAASVELLRGLNTLTFLGKGLAAQPLFERLERERTACTGHEAEISRMLAYWLLHRASHHYDALDLGGAKAALTRSCELGLKASCAITKELDAELRASKLPEVDAPLRGGEPLGAFTHVMETDGTVRLRGHKGFRWFSPGLGSSVMVEEMSLLDTELKILIARDTPSPKVLGLLEALGTPENREKRARAQSLMRKENTPAQIYVPAMQGGQRRGLTIYVPPLDPKDPAVIRARVSAMGLAFEGPGGVKRDRSCPPRKRCGAPSLAKLTSGGRALASAFPNLKGPVRVSLRPRSTMSFEETLRVIAAIEAGFAEQGKTVEVSLTSR